MSDDERSGSRGGDISDSWEEDADDIAEDDEGTLEEEEALDADENELDELQQLEDEQDLSVEELRRRYYGSENGPPPDPEPSTSNGNGTSVPHRLPTEVATNSTAAVADGDGPGPSSSAGGEATVKEHRGEHGYFSDDEEDDDDYVPPEPWKKQIRVGTDYQVDPPTYRCTPPTPCNGASSSPDSQLDSLLWRPADIITADQVESYLRQFYSGQPGSPVSKRSRLDGSSVDSTASDLLPDINGDSATHPLPPAVLRDDEDALYLLLSCRYDRTAALKRKTAPMAANSPVRTIFAPARAWDDADCTRFEEGLRLHGKNFCTIQREQLSNRSVGELVQFYYVWKKTERHDMFVQRVRFEKRQFALNPDTTDFMDHFIGQMDATTGASGSAGTSGGRTTGGGGRIDTPPPLTLMHPEPSMSSAGDSVDHPSSSTLISSDPKYAHGQWHATHFNEWNPSTVSAPVAAAAADGTSVALPHLDGDTVAKALQ